MIKKIHLLILIFLAIEATAQDDPLITFYEKSGFKATPSYDETVAYCKQLDQASPFILYTTFGTSPQGRKLPLLIIDGDGRFDPASAKRNGKLVLLIQAGIHPGEIDGKDAGFMFFRDLAIRQQFGAMPENLTILFIPVLNVDGHERFGPYNRINQDGPEEMGWRTTAQNLNLNRDFLKADAPEMQAWLKLFQQWLPDFMVDIHVTDGADYQYVMTYGLETFGNMDEGLTNWTVERFIPGMESRMESAGYPCYPYVMFRRWHDPRSGLRSGAAGPRYSQGYAAAQNRIGLLVENHSLKDYKTRVSSTYELLHFLCSFTNDNAPVIIDLNRGADNYAASSLFRQQDFPVNFMAGKDSIMVDFQGVEYDVEKSDLTGGDWFRYHPDKPATFQVPYFYQQVPSAKVKIPEAYVVPPEWIEIIGKLSLHGISYSILGKTAKIEVESYRFTKVEYGKNTYEGRTQVTPAFETFTEEREYPAGSVLIPTNQRNARIITHMFEPASPDSYLQWGFFNITFELKEYFETYVMEEYARKMLAEKPGLKEEFEKWKEENPEAARSQWSQLEWFYFRSPWVDAKRNVYPIGRILDKTILKEILQN
jgi:hypothetical protein